MGQQCSNCAFLNQIFKYKAKSVSIIEQSDFLSAFKTVGEARDRISSSIFASVYCDFWQDITGDQASIFFLVKWGV